jgi:hypothetical protein
MKSLLRTLGLAAILVVMNLQPASAGLNGYGCTGTCTVTCFDGTTSTTYSIQTLDYRCCTELRRCEVEGTAEWWPDGPTVGICRNSAAFVCP